MWLAFLALALAFNVPPLARQTTRCSSSEGPTEPLDEDTMVGLDDGGMAAEFNRHMLRRAVQTVYAEQRAADRLRRIKRRKPRFLAYDDAAKWVQKMAQWDTADEWRGWIESGEKRNPYIPNNPVKYYGDKWRGWEHFLNGTVSTTSPPRLGE